ncbi:hypothetical protein, conserved [Eimeria praecox]|uniref:Uncharacterized protein n=1 Tax=Eimeria praecox TaxID=51316 RepID=U6G622_9EIME|nr:hypothetical protein, conserved [Eimeria praecox]
MWNLSSRRASLALLRVQGTGTSPDMSTPCVLPEGTAVVQRWYRGGSAAADAAADAATPAAATAGSSSGSPPGPHADSAWYRGGSAAADAAAAAATPAAATAGSSSGSPPGPHADSADASGNGGARERRSPGRQSASAFRAFSTVKNFSRVACLAFPEEAANASSRLGYARLQLLLGYVVPEILEEEPVAEDNGDSAQETAGTSAGSQPALHVPYRPYIGIRGCPVAFPISLLSLSLACYARRAPEQSSCLLLVLLALFRTVFTPFAVLDDGILSGKEEAFVVLQGSRYLHRSQDTRSLIKEPSCGICGECSGSCKHSSTSNSRGGGVDTEGSSLYTAELDEGAIAKDVQQQLQQQLQHRQQGQGEFGGCRIRLMLQLLPHKTSECGTIPLLDELSALLLPTPQETQEAALPPLNFPAVWSDIQDAHRKLTEGYFLFRYSWLYDAVYWERPVLSFACLLAFIFLWKHPCFLPAALLFLSGLLLLIVSFIHLPTPPVEASSACRVDSAAAAAAPAAATAATAAEAGPERGRGISPEGPRQRGRPGSLKAFEIRESENCAEASLLRSLLSAAVPPPLQLRVRQCHIVGALWVLGAWAAAEPASACSIASYLVLASGLALLTSRLAVVGAAVRLLLACYREVRLCRQRRGRQHLIAAPMG